MEASDLGTEALFTQYIDVVNRALGEHRNDIPYKQIFTVGEKVLGDRKLGVAVYKNDPENPHHHFTITLDGGTFKILETGKGEADIVWKVRDDHLENVVENPQEFVDRPAKLDLDWLQKRLGVT
jgi:hypothetical protein